MQNTAKLVVANWKMNLGVPESVDYFMELTKKIELDGKVEVVICPTFLALFALKVKNQDKFKLGAQNCHANRAGAFTGEVAAAMLQGVADYVIVGHSERRRYFGETDSDVNQKLLACLESNLKPIVCIGETLNQRQSGETDTTLRNQLDGALQKVRSPDLADIVIAYEPVWAIGSAKTPSGSELQLALHTIKTQLAYMFGAASDQVKLLYGGSVDDQNAAKILDIPEVSGFLVGNSSLNANKFATIVKIAKGSGYD